jgi:predicted enzyme related to lactoylglutathione lyase
LGLAGSFFERGTQALSVSGTAIISASHWSRRTMMNCHGGKEAGTTVFAPFPETTDYFGNAEKVWMINFRVRNLEAMVGQLRAAGLSVEVDPELYPHGRFARLYDPEGNPIELWEPGERNAG